MEQHFQRYKEEIRAKAPQKYHIDLVRLKDAPKALAFLLREAEIDLSIAGKNIEKNKTNFENAAQRLAELKKEIDEIMSVGAASEKSRQQAAAELRASATGLAREVASLKRANDENLGLIEGLRHFIDTTKKILVKFNEYFKEKEKKTEIDEDDLFAKSGDGEEVKVETINGEISAEEAQAFVNDLTYVLKTMAGKFDPMKRPDFSPLEDFARAHRKLIDLAKAGGRKTELIQGLYDKSIQNVLQAYHGRHNPVRDLMKLEQMRKYLPNIRI